MRPALVERELRHARHEAVLDLKRAGSLAEAERALALFPEPGPKAGLLGKALAAVVVSGAIGMLTFALGVMGGVRSATSLALFCAGLLAVATEALLSSERFALSGAAGTAAFWAWVYLVVGLASASSFSSRGAAAVLAVAALAGAAAAWRWGMPLHAILGAGALLALLARLEEGRLLWLLVPLLAAVPLERALDRPRAPSHRAALAALLGTLLVALYGALNLWSVAETAVEGIGGRSGHPARAWFVAAWWGTFLVPLAVLAWGAATRRRWLLALGLLFGTLSAITLRRFIHVAPLWELLLFAGTLVALLALGLMRLFSRERLGFTDDPLLSRPERAEALGTALLVASQLAPARGVRAEPAERGSRFASGGGDSGGGGASDSY